MNNKTSFWQSKYFPFAHILKGLHPVLHIGFSAGTTCIHYSGRARRFPPEIGSPILPARSQLSELSNDSFSSMHNDLNHRGKSECDICCNIFRNTFSAPIFELGWFFATFVPNHMHWRWGSCRTYQSFLTLYRNDPSLLSVPTWTDESWWCHPYSHSTLDALCICAELPPLWVSVQSRRTHRIYEV